ncbi:MAG: SIS domain-containing protein [Alphaproteobacteria bacterium]
MTPEKRFDTDLAEHIETAEATRAALRAPFARLVGICADSVRAGNKLLLFGNGGSAGDAQHIATELTVRFSKDRAPIAALALNVDSSALTAIGNDLGFDQLFARQLRALGNAGDVAIGITTSGRSRNVTLALEVAREMGIVPAAFGGGDGGDLPGLADPLLIVPAVKISRIQEMHISIGHMLCGALEHELGLV